MYKCFRFLGCLGLASVCNVSYGTPYPSLKDIEANLDAQGGIGAVVGKVFKDVYQQAEVSGFEKSDFENLKLIGEGNGSLTLPRGLGVRYYRPQDYRDWQWKFDTIYGFFSCTVNGASVFNEETLRKAVEASEEKRLEEKMLLRSDTKKIEEIMKVCQVLLSEEFAKKLLTEPLLQALYDNKDAAYSCFDVKFSPHAFEENIFRFDVKYSQTVKEEKQQAKGASVFAVWFHFGYNPGERNFGGQYHLEDGGNRFVPYLPRLEYLEVNGDSFRSNPLNFDERAMERVWQHPYWASTMCQGKEKISREEEKAVAEEEELENSVKSKESLGLEEEKEEDWNDVFEEEEREKSENDLRSKEDEEEDLKVHAEVHAEEYKEDEASELCDPNKRPRSPDSEDEESEGDFKKKKM